MSKTLKKYIPILVAALLALALFVVMLCLSVPIGGRASVLPSYSFYIAGGISAAFFLTFAVIFLIGSRRGS